MHGGVRGVDRGEAGIDADVRDDHAEVALAESTAADQFFELGDFLLGLDQPRAGRRLHVDHELAGVGARKEGESEQREQQQAGREADGEDDQAESRAAAGRRATSVS